MERQGRNALTRPLFVLLAVAVGAVSGTSILVSDLDQRKIVRISLETGDLEAEIADETLSRALAYDPLEREIYRSDETARQIKKSDLNGNSVSVVVNINVTDEIYEQYEYPEANGQEYEEYGLRSSLVNGMALDPEARILFYSVYNSIEAVFLENGTAMTVLFSDNPGDIVLDTDNGLLYFCGGRFDVRIFSSNYDGSNFVDLKLVAESRSPSRLAFDRDNKVFFWTESTWASYINSVEVDETGPLGESLGFFVGFQVIDEIDYFDGMLFVSNITFNDFMNETFYSIPADGGNKTYINIGEYEPDVFIIIPGDDFDAFRPDIYYELVNTGVQTSELVFYCNFSQQAAAQSYKTNWFVDDTLILTTPSGSWDNGDVIMQQALTETQMKAEGFATFGIEVACSVEATFSASNMTTSPLSYQTFIGIKTQSPARLSEGQVGEITLALTAPFGCGQTTPDDQCKLIIEILPNEPTTACSTATLVPSTCRLEILASQWNTPISLTVLGRITSTYAFLSNTVTIRLKTASFSFQTTWGDYLVTVGILVTKTADVYRSRHCASTNDPHLRTFDSRRYELHYLGNFILYRHKQLPVEVQMQTILCGQNPNIFCNCGVVVRAGRTVFAINLCSPDEDDWVIDYLQCEEGGNDLIVKRRGNSLTYMIYLPTGGQVVVNAYRLINIQVYPSALDVENTEGLCGFMSEDGICSDDFFLRNGNYSEDDTSRGDCFTGYNVWQNVMNTFIDSWRVQENENLFDEDNLASLDPWPQENTFCTCPEPTGGLGPPAAPICSADQSVESCSTMPGFEDVSSRTCTVARRRRRRSSMSSETKFIRKKRGLFGPFNLFTGWRNGWTNESALAYCEGLFDNSLSMQACDSVPGVDINDGKRICLIDIFYLATTDFDIFAIDEVATKCLHEVYSNPQLRETVPGSNESVFSIVNRQVCLIDCNNRGTCSNDGVCNCEENWGGAACNVDLTTPPRLFEIGRNGLCDTNTENCDVVSIFGALFVDGAKCRFVTVKVANNQNTDLGVTESVGTTQSILDLECQLPAAIEPSSEASGSVLAYRVSVANSGNLFSNELGLMVYDSRCIIPSVDGTDFEWTVKGPYCVSRGMCYENNANHPSANLRCNAATNTWIRVSTGNLFLRWWRRFIQWVLG